MGYLVRTLKFLAVLMLVGAIVLWFAARRGDRGYIHAEITIDRGAPVVFRWITTDELLRRWIADVTKLERIGAAAANSDFHLEENVAGQPVAFARDFPFFLRADHEHAYGRSGGRDVLI